MTGNGVMSPVVEPSSSVYAQHELNKAWTAQASAGAASLPASEASV
jgi:hypothetical protein